MPTTTNFGWTTPADTDLVKDGAAAIRTLGNGIDTSFLDLKGGTTGQILSKNSNTDLDFTWVAQDDSNAIQNALLTTTGDTIYASAASTPARLGIGSTGQVLTVSGGVPVWASPAGGGKVLQVVQATYATEMTVSSTTYTDTGLSVTITPSSATSKVLILVSQPVGVGRPASAVAVANIRLVRTSTAIFTLLRPTGVGAAINESGNIENWALAGFSYLDSPATTSATTYKTQLASGSTYTATANVSNSNSSIIALEIGA